MPLQVGPRVAHLVLRAGGAQPLVLVLVPVLVPPPTQAREQVPVFGPALMEDLMILQPGAQASVPVLALVPVLPLAPTLVHGPGLVGALMQPPVGAPTPVLALVLPLVRLQKQVQVHHPSVERDLSRLQAMVQVLLMPLDQAQEKVVVHSLAPKDDPTLLQVEALTLILNRGLLLTQMQVQDQLHLLVR